jgi:hypothetical protein
MLVVTAFVVLPDNADRSGDVTETEMSIDTGSDVDIDKPSILDNLPDTSGYFTENHGQIEEDEVRFYTQGGGIWLLDGSVMIVIQEQQEPVNTPEFAPGTGFPNEKEETFRSKGVAIKLIFEEANDVEPEGQSLLPHKSNFFYGNDPSKWRTQVPHYNEILYQDIYDNIDLVFKNIGEGLKYEFIVHPGGDVSDIRMKYEGIEKLSISTSGDLEIHTELGVITDSNLYIYQEKGEIEVEGEFEILDPTTYGFDVSDDYDKESDLVIDPFIYMLKWSTFMGGDRYDIGEDIAVEHPNLVFVTGTTESPDFPTQPGAYDDTYNGSGDVFIFALDKPSGSILMGSTFIGGNESDYGTSIAVDYYFHNYIYYTYVYITGYTNSENFPTENAYDPDNNGDYDAFVLKLNWTGQTLIYSTYVGGEKTDKAYDLFLSSGCVHVTGGTNSTDFPFINGYNNESSGGFDVFVFKLNILGNALEHSTYIGGMYNDTGYSVTFGYMSGPNDVCVTGTTNSPNFPISNAYDPSWNGNYDAFVFVLSDYTQLDYSTFVGGDENESGYSIEQESLGSSKVYVTGYTQSNNFPENGYNNILNPSPYDSQLNGPCDVYVIKLNTFATGVNSLEYYTLFGGNGSDIGHHLDFVSGAHGWWVTGETNSLDFPITDPTYDNTSNGGYDAFVFRGNTTELKFSTYVGGAENDLGKSIAYYGGYVYVTGQTNSSNFPTKPSVYDEIYNASGDVFVFKGFWLFPAFFIEIEPPVVSLREIDMPDDLYAYIAPSSGFNLPDIDPDSIKIESADDCTLDFPARSGSGKIGDYDNNGTLELRVEFDMKAFIALLTGLVEPPAYVELTVSGMLYNGTQFLGTVIILIIDENTMKVTPDTLNLKSKGRWISCRIELPEGVDVNDLDISTVKISDIDGSPVDISAENHPTGDDGILILKFDRAEVEDCASPGEIKITIEGELLDGRPFGAYDTINVINP